MTKTAAILGGGVIGGGWAAPFLLNGWAVPGFDPDPEAEELNRQRFALAGQLLTLVLSQMD